MSLFLSQNCTILLIYTFKFRFKLSNSAFNLKDLQTQRFSINDIKTFCVLKISIYLLYEREIRIINFQEVETTEKNAFTRKIDKVKYKVTKARSDLRVKVSFTTQFTPSNLSLPPGPGWTDRAGPPGEVG